MSKMSRTIQFTGALVLALLACSSLAAQMRGGSPSGASARVVPMHAAPIARAPGVSAAPSVSGTHASRQATVIQIAPSGRVTSRAGSFASSGNFDDENGNGVPGLGFDYVHLAAVSGNFRNPPSFGRGSHRERNFVTPVFFGGFGGFPYYSDFTDYQPVQQQPQVIVIQQPVPAVVAQEPAPSARDTYPDAAAPAAPPAPVREVGEFILVRRDGRILFASVFSVIGSQLQYVTPEGIRRTLPLAELDIVATQDMNEARGTTVQLHN
jgi:hypothetical protein